MHKKVKNMISTSDPRVCMIGHPAPAWLVNYADLMTELVCFFIVLYALSAALSKDVQQAKKEVEEAMKQEQVQGEVKVDKDGMKITLEEQGDNVFFHSGSAEVSDRMKEIMAKIVPSLQNLAKQNHQIVVEGHTDNIPIRTSHFPSNWELSTARATSVVQYMIKSMAFPPDKLGAIGYGQFQPIAPNDSEENRSKNRRVVFFVKNSPIQPVDEAKKENPKEEAKPAASTAETAASDTAAEDEEEEESEEAVPASQQTTE
jgi:chemotaxis protein MotB